MNTEATIDALRILRRLKYAAIDPVGLRIIESAIYHLERALQEYLTRGN